MSYNGKALADYIARHSWNGGWDVVLLKTGTGDPFSKMIKCGSEQLEITHTESRKIRISNNMLSVSENKLRVGAGGCAKIGLTKTEIQSAEAAFRNNYKGKSKKPNVPDSAYLTQNRQPILMIHIIDANYTNKTKTKYPQFLYALGVGFPSDDTGDEIAIYQVNLVELANWMDPDDEMDE